MKISEKKFESLKARARAVRSKVLSGGKGSAIAAATGAGAAFVGHMASEKIEFVGSHWWAEGAVLAGIGHFLKRKHHDIGTALLGAGGYAIARAYQTKPAGSQNEAKAVIDAGYFHPEIENRVNEAFAHLGAGAYVDPMHDVPGANAVIDAHGTDDAGAVVDAADAYGL